MQAIERLADSRSAKLLIAIQPNGVRVENRPHDDLGNREKQVHNDSHDTVLHNDSVSCFHFHWPLVLSQGYASLLSRFSALPGRVRVSREGIP